MRGRLGTDHASERGALSEADAMMSRMGVLFDYYAATDDQHATRAIVREDGAPSGTGYDEFVVKSIDPVVQLVPAEALVTGRPADATAADTRHGRLVAMVADGEVVSVALTDVFRDAPARFDDDLLDDVAKGWVASDVFWRTPEPDDLADFFRQLAGLAQRAVADGSHLYCWICP